MKRTIAILATVLSACGSGDDAPPPCSLAARNALFLLSFTTVGGNCGPIDTSLATLAANSDVTPCTRLAPDIVTADQCTVTEQLDCSDASGTLKVTQVTTQQDPDGKRFTGAATLEVSDASSGNSCNGTFRIEGVRQ